MLAHGGSLEVLEIIELNNIGIAVRIFKHCSLFNLYGVSGLYSNVK